MGNDYQEIMDRIKKLFEDFTQEAAKGEGNKAAAGRARKISGEIGKTMKEYRSTSIEFHKK